MNTPTHKFIMGMAGLVLTVATLVVTNTAQASALTPPLIVASNSSISTSDACAGLEQIDSKQGCSTSGSGVSSIVKAAVSILSYIVGVAAVIMVIVAGFKYVTSAGDSGRISSAKNTLVYALVGLAVAALAQVLVHLVLTDTTKAANGAKITRAVTTTQSLTIT